MTRKDYVLIAAALKAAKPEGMTGSGWRLQHERDCNMVAEALQRENARFDLMRFLKACGLDWEPEE